MNEPLVGQTLARYKILRALARGGMGVVYLAEDFDLGRMVALKILDPDLARDPVLHERFVRESTLASRLDHPNIVPVYEAGIVEGTQYIAMRYVDGPSLATTLQVEARLSPRRAIPIIAQIGSALDAAHTRGLVHRDVKPGNILLDVGRGPSGIDHAYLCDFGLAQDAREGIERLTKTGQFVGTVDYMSPEQIIGGKVEGATDQYALACIAYEALVGLRPFLRRGNAAVLMAHMHEMPDPVEDRADLGEADRVLRRALSKSSDDRYSTCGEFVRELRESLGLGRSEVPGLAPTLSPALAAAPKAPKEQASERRPLREAAPWLPAEQPPGSRDRRRLFIAAGLGFVVGLAIAATLILR